MFMIGFDLCNKLSFNLDNGLLQLLNDIFNFIKNNKLECGIFLILIIIIVSYFLIRKYIFGINIQGQLDDYKYIKYLKRTWIKYFSQEKSKKYIFNILKEFCNDHTLLIPNWKKFFDCDRLDQHHKEYLIGILFDLLERCVEIKNEVAPDYIIEQLQTQFDKNSFFITDKIEKDEDKVYIKKNIAQLSKKISDTCSSSTSYEVSELYVRFHNRYKPSHYDKFILDKEIDLLKKLRIIWLIYESDSASREDILQRIKMLSGVHPKIIDFINVLLEEKKIPQNTLSEITIVENNPTTGDMPNDCLCI